MPTFFKDWIFNQLPKYIQRTDSYPNVNGDGVLKRYLQTSGIELDEQFIPYIVNFLDIVDVIKCDEKFLPLIGSILGYPPSIDGLSTTYRKILANILAIYKVKGTKTSFEMLFNLLGLEIEIIEEVPGKGIKYDDSPVDIYDEAIPNQYDSHCAYCSGYWISYNSKADTCNPFVHNIVPAPLLSTVQNIICFLNPINATFNGLLERFKVCDTVDLTLNDGINLCGIPLNIVVSYNTTTRVAQISWQGSGNFQMQYREYPSGIFSSPITANSGDLITGLTNDIIYEIEVRKDCGSGSYSEWVSYLLYTGNGILNDSNSGISLKDIVYISNSPTITLLGDYSIVMDMTNPVLIISILINGQWILGNSTPFTTINGVNTWLNTLGKGAFTLSGNTITSLGNPNTISQITCVILGVESTIFWGQSNKRLVDSTLVDIISDYSILPIYPLTVQSILINGVSPSGSGLISNDTDFLSWLNGLGKGTFIVDSDGNITTLGNGNWFDKIVFNTPTDSINRDLLFKQSNIKLSSTSNNLLTTDYLIYMDFTNAIKITSIKINNADVPGTGGLYATNDELVIWLNSLNKGLFQLIDGNIVSKNNVNLISSLIYSTSVDSTNYTVSFIQTNQLITNLTGSTGTISLNVVLASKTYYVTGLPAGKYDKITLEIAPDNIIPITGGNICTDNGTGPYIGFLDNGNLVFVNVTLGTLFQLNLL